MTFRLTAIHAAMLAGLLWPQGVAAQVKVVASFSILADMVREVGGDLVAVKTLVGAESDAHVYQPTPADARAVAEARLVFVNGLGFEGWLDRMLQASGTKAEIVVASAGVAQLAEKAHRGHGHAKSAEAAVDPHAWQDARNGVVYAGNIAKALAAVDPAHASRYRAAGENFAARIRATDAEIRGIVGAVPAEKRKVITSHDSFRYFGAAYGVEFLAARGISTESEPTAKDIARLIDQMRKTGVKALFVESVADPRLIEQIAREAGGMVGPALFSDALSKPGGPADSYLKMLRHNASVLASATAKN